LTDNARLVIVKLSPIAVLEWIMAEDDDSGSSPRIAELLTSVDSKLDLLLAQSRFAALGPSREFQFLFQDRLVKMFLPFADVDVIQRNILTHHCFYEVRALQRVRSYIGPDSVVLDAGANIGNHTIFFAKICDAKEVVAFEVMRETFALLERNIRLNDLDNVRLFNAALGARQGYAKLSHFGQGNIGGASIKVIEQPGAYEVVTIDGLTLPALHFLKIDVEGGFLDVLQGASDTLTRLRPLIWIELRANKDEREPGEEMLRRLGYRMRVELSRNDFLFEPV
jgi:FkbM family methyltransferase